MKLIRSSFVFSFPLPLRRLLFIKDATKKQKISCFIKMQFKQSKEYKMLYKSNCAFGLPRWLRGRECTSNARDARDLGPIPGSERSPGVGNGNLLQYSCLGYSTQKNLVVYSPWGHKESDRAE